MMDFNSVLCLQVTLIPLTSTPYTAKYPGIAIKLFVLKEMNHITDKY